MTTPSASLLAVLALVLHAPAMVQTPSPEGELDAGIRKVEEGDLEGAVFTLDGAIRELANEPGRERDRATAHLYMAMALLGLGQVEKAEASVREAWSLDEDRVLDPKRFPPTILRLLEQARTEAVAGDTGGDPDTVPEKEGAEAPGEVVPTTEAARKKGGSKLPLVLVGVGAAGGLGLAVAGGGGDQVPAPMATPTPTPAPTPVPTPVILTQRFASTDVPREIRDSSTTLSSLSFPNRGTIREVVGVFVSIQHTYVGDLIVSVAHPDGAAVTLWNRAGGHQDDIHETFTPSTTAALETFVGKEANGIWRLTIADEVEGDQGMLLDWALELTIETLGQ